MSAPGRLAVLAVLLGALAAPAAAMTCSFTSVVGVAFGAYDVFSATPLDSTGSVTFLCTGGSPGPITIDLGTGAGTFGQRTLINGASSLGYNLYLSATRTGSVWGDGTSSTAHYGPTTPTLDSETTVTVYGRVPAQQNVAAGGYSDTVVVTITY